MSLRDKMLTAAQELESVRPKFTHPDVKTNDGSSPVILAMNNDGSWCLHHEVAKAIPQHVWDAMVEFVAETMKD